MKKILTFLLALFISATAFSQEGKTFIATHFRAFDVKTQTLDSGVINLSASFYLARDTAFIDVTSGGQTFTFYNSKHIGNHDHNDGGYGATFDLAAVTDNHLLGFEIFYDKEGEIKALGFKDYLTGNEQFYY